MAMNLLQAMQFRGQRWLCALAMVLALVPRPALASVSYLLRWTPPQGEVTGYRVYISNTREQRGRPLLLGAVAPGPDGVASKVVPGFDPTLTTYVYMRAFNSAGDSEESNELVIQATQCGMSCDDGNSCTVDSCSAGRCVAKPVSGRQTCDDGIAATTGDICRAGVCAGSLTPPPPP